MRAEIFEETLDALIGFWSAEPFDYEGKHLHITSTHLTPAPVQQPHPPVWVGAKWPNRKPFVRAAKWDGVAPVMDDRAMTPDDITDLLELIGEKRGSLDGYEVVYGGRSEPGSAGAEHIAPFAEAGVTWWVEAMKPEGNWQTESLRRAAAGPSLG